MQERSKESMQARVWSSESRGINTDSHPTLFLKASVSSFHIIRLVMLSALKSAPRPLGGWQQTFLLFSASPGAAVPSTPSPHEGVWWSSPAGPKGWELCNVHHRVSCSQHLFILSFSECANGAAHNYSSSRGQVEYSSREGERLFLSFRQQHVNGISYFSPASFETLAKHFPDNY